MKLWTTLLGSLLGAAALAGTLGAPGAAQASSIRVCPTCAFKTIQPAINAAHGGDVISIAPGTYIENLSVGAGAATPLTLVAERGGPVTVNGSQHGSVLTVAANHSVKLIGLTLTNGKAANGGGIDSAGTLEVIGGQITGNTAAGTIDLGTGFGGGIFNDSGTLTVSGTTISGNHAARGAGVATGSPTAVGSATLNNSVIENNTAGAAAGGIATCGSLTLNRTRISGNTAGQGGGLTNCGPIASGVFGTAVLNSSPVTGNHATGGTSPEGIPLPGHGGGISNAGALTLNGSPVTNNTAPAGMGGGIFNQGGTVSLHGSAVSGNTPPQCVSDVAIGC